MLLLLSFFFLAGVRQVGADILALEDLLERAKRGEREVIPLLGKALEDAVEENDPRWALLDEQLKNSSFQARYNLQDILLVLYPPQLFHGGVPDKLYLPPAPFVALLQSFGFQSAYDRIASWAALSLYWERDTPYFNNRLALQRAAFYALLDHPTPANARHLFATLQRLQARPYVSDILRILGLSYCDVRGATVLGDGENNRILMNVEMADPNDGWMTSFIDLPIQPSLLVAEAQRQSGIFRFPLGDPRTWAQPLFEGQATAPLLNLSKEEPTLSYIMVYPNGLGLRLSFFVRPAVSPPSATDWQMQLRPTLLFAPAEGEDFSSRYLTDTFRRSLRQAMGKGVSWVLPAIQALLDGYRQFSAAGDEQRAARAVELLGTLLDLSRAPQSIDMHSWHEAVLHAFFQIGMSGRPGSELPFPKVQAALLRGLSLVAPAGVLSGEMRYLIGRLKLHLAADDPLLKEANRILSFDAAAKEGHALTDVFTPPPKGLTMPIPPAPWRELLLARKVAGGVREEARLYAELLRYYGITGKPNATQQTTLLSEASQLRSLSIAPENARRLALISPLLLHLERARGLPPHSPAEEMKIRIQMFLETMRRISERPREIP